jgi:hypothetical protein
MRRRKFIAGLGIAREIARGMKIPFEPDPVLSPSIFYGSNPTAPLYTTAEDNYVRVTFEGLDSIKACRGECFPYPLSSPRHGTCHVIDNSRWLIERHAYEDKHYRNCYEFGNDVDMTDYNHFVFSFHDEFIEAIAAGIWFEQRTTAFTPDTPVENHPLMELPQEKTTERLEMSGIACTVGSNRKSDSEITEESRYCSQPLFHIALELDGQSSVCCRFNVRTRNGSTKTT